MNKETAILGGGCFWCTEAVFKILRGIISVAPGYAGGTIVNPTYIQVCEGTTGHAEVVKVEFDPSILSFSDLLTVFFGTHDPTTLNRQGNDVGTQYRSVIFYTSDKQKAEAEKFIQEINDSNSEGKAIVTEVEPAPTFYEAESYHHDYYANNKTKGYCEVIINPKLQKVQEKFGALLKEKTIN